MNPEELEPLAKKPEKEGFWTLKRAITVMTGVLVLNLAGLGISLWGQNDLRIDQERLRQQNLTNRVQGCKIQIALEVELDGSCVTREILGLYDPESLIRNQGNFRSDLQDVLCFIAENDGGHFPRVCGV